MNIEWACSSEQNCSGCSHALSKNGPDTIIAGNDEFKDKSTEMALDC